MNKKETQLNGAGEKGRREEQKIEPKWNQPSSLGHVTSSNPSTLMLLYLALKILMSLVNEILRKKHFLH